MDISDYHIATKKIHELEQELETTSALCKTLTTIVNEAMHWLPISEDAVFDRSESMLFRLAKYDTTDASGIYHGTYLDMVETYRPFITHYARITEPK